MEKEMAEVLYLYEELEQLADEDFVYDMKLTMNLQLVV